MKKIFKAIPLLSSAAVLSAPTIALTSCSKNYYEEFTYTFDNDEHKPASFLPEGKSKLTKATQQQAIDDFFSACSNNKKILADQLVYQFINASRLTPTLSFTGTIKAEIGKIDMENYAFTYRLNVDVFDYSQNEYKCTITATNVRYVIFYTDSNDWRMTNVSEYLQYIGMDMYLQGLIIASNRYHWRVELDMDENSTQNFLNAIEKRWQIPYVGPLYISVDSNDYPDDRRYVDIYGIQTYLYGNTIVQTYYLRDVQHIEE